MIWYRVAESKAFDARLLLCSQQSAGAEAETRFAASEPQPVVVGHSSGRAQIDAKAGCLGFQRRRSSDWVMGEGSPRN